VAGSVLELDSKPVHFIMKNDLYKNLNDMITQVLSRFFSASDIMERPLPFLYYGFLLKFEVLKLKTCSLYHEKLFIQTLSDMINQILNRFFSASDFHTFYDSKKKHFEFSNQDRRS
jgi:hypothetical protein